MSRIGPNAALAVALVLVLAGPWLVLGAFDSAGGRDRPRPLHGLLHTELGCLDHVWGEPHMIVPSTSCPTITPRGLADEYRAAWMGFGLGLGGATLALVLAGRPSATRRRAYLLLGPAAAWLLLVAMAISDWFEFDLTSLGTEPPPRDAFDRIAIALLIEGLVLVPAGIVLRRVLPRPAAGEPAGAN